jgi:hypothetical protein
MFILGNIDLLSAQPRRSPTVSLFNYFSETRFLCCIRPSSSRITSTQSEMYAMEKTFPTQLA